MSVVPPVGSRPRRRVTGGALATEHAPARGVLIAVVLLAVVGGCSGPGSDDVAAGDRSDADTSNVTDDAASADAPSGEDDADADEATGDDEGADASDPPDASGDDGDGDGPGDVADDGTGADDGARGEGEGGDGPDADGPAEAAAPTDTSHLADLARAEPGTWPVGDAGTVTFELARRDLVLLDVDGRPGWSVEVTEDARDEIAVVFRRDAVRWRFEVERSRRHLDVVIEQRIPGAATGGYDLGEAGTFAFDVVDRRLVLTSLEVADGWEVRDRDVDDEHLELDLRADGRRVEVEVELDGRSVDLEIVYEVRDRIR